MGSRQPVQQQVQRYNDRGISRCPRVVPVVRTGLGGSQRRLDSDRCPGRPTHNRAVQHRGRVSGSELFLETAGGAVAGVGDAWDGVGARRRRPHEAHSHSGCCCCGRVRPASLRFGHDGNGRACAACGQPACVGSRVGARPLHSAGYTEIDYDSRGSSLSPNPGLAARTAGGSRSTAGVGDLLGRTDAEPAARGGGYRDQPADRNRARTGPQEPPARGEADVRGVHRGVPGSASHYAAVHVAGAGAAGVP